MVPSEQCHLVRPPCLQHHQPGQSLQAVVPSVHKVPHEDVVSVRRRPAGSVQDMKVNKWLILHKIATKAHLKSSSRS